MDGGVTQMTSASWQISRFHNAIENWFRYKGCSFDVKTYDRFERNYAKGNQKSSTAEVNHQLEAHGGSYRNCEKYGSIPDEPLRKDYFPEEPQSCLLSEVLASVIGVQHLDGVPVDGYSTLRRIKERFGAARAGFYCFLFLFSGGIRYRIFLILTWHEWGSEMPQWLHLLVYTHNLLTPGG